MIEGTGRCAVRLLVRPRFLFSHCTTLLFGADEAVQYFIVALLEDIYIVSFHICIMILCHNKQNYLDTVRIINSILL